MSDEKPEENAPAQEASPDSLEQSDDAESLRQLWWTIGVTGTALVVLAFFYL